MRDFCRAGCWNGCAEKARGTYGIRMEDEYLSRK